MEGHQELRISMSHGDEQFFLMNRFSDLFFYFSSQGLSGRFSLFYFAAGEFPKVCQKPFRGSFLDEKF